jgi:hypothetical protein
MPIAIATQRVKGTIMAHAIKAEVVDPRARTFVFTASGPSQEISHPIGIRSSPPSIFCSLEPKPRCKILQSFN